MKLTEHFDLTEFSCHDGSQVPQLLIANARRLAENLEVLRAELALPIHVMSGYRTEAYNRKCGGAKASKHLTAEAADVQVGGIKPSTVHAVILRLIGEGKMHDGGVGSYIGFTHYDVRVGGKRWVG